MSPANMSKVEASVRTVMEFNDAFNRHDVQGMMQLASDDTVFENTHPSPDGTKISGKEAVTQIWQDFFRESPKANIEIEEIFGMGNQVCDALEIHLGRRSRPRGGCIQTKGWVDRGKVIVCEGVRSC